MNREAWHFDVSVIARCNQCLRIFACAMAILVLVLVMARPIAAQAIETPARNAILIDATTGTVLLGKAADVAMPPASMSKLMTIYMVFERLKDGSL